jgi:hypothetical protein
VTPEEIRAYYASMPGTIAPGGGGPSMAQAAPINAAPTVIGPDVINAAPTVIGPDVINAPPTTIGPDVVNAAPTTIGPDTINAAPTVISDYYGADKSTYNPTPQSDADAAAFMGKSAPPEPAKATAYGSSGTPSAYWTGPSGAGPAPPPEDWYERSQGVKPRGEPTFQRGDFPLPSQQGGGAPRGGGGKPAGPSEYSRGMAGLRGTYDKDKVATQEEADAQVARANVNAVGAAALAQQKIDDQLAQQVEAADAARRFGDYSAETQKQIDDVRAQKFNPNERYADTGSALMAIVGGVLGGMYQGLNKLEKNPFIEQMNKNLDRDFAVFESNLRTQKEGIGERRHLLAEMRATYKDEATAKLQAKNLYYEGAKEAIAAQAAGFDSPTIQARADQAINALSREQSKLDIQEALRKAAMAAAAAAAAEARRERDFKHRLELDEHARKWADTQISADKTRREGGKEHKAAVAHVGDKLAEADKQGVATDLEHLRKFLIDPKTGKYDSSRSIPGVGRLDDLRHDIAPPLGKGGALDVVGAAGPAGWAARGGSAAVLGLNPVERQNRNRYGRAFLGFKNLKTGAAASEKEHARIVDAWEGDGTTEEKADAVEQAYQWVQRNKDAIRAENPEATAEYEQNLRDQAVRDQEAASGRERP